MRRELIEQVRDYFANIQEIDENEEHFLNELNKELEDHEIAFVNKAALERHGFDTTDIADSDLNEVACIMGDYYCNSRFSGDLISACEDIGLPKKPRCPMCHEEVEIGLTENGAHRCNSCEQIWRDLYVLVQHPNETEYFHNKEIGYPASGHQDNNARYISEWDYLDYFAESAPEDQIFKPVQWPESQKYHFEKDSIDALCEDINDETGIIDFGSAARWVPLCLLSSEGAVPNDKVAKARSEHAALIAEIDADPEKWYELFVNEGDEVGTHTVDSGDTFEEAVADYEKYAVEYGADNVFLDVWENRENPEQTNHRGLL